MKPTFDRKTACNTGFASGGLTCKVGAMCIYSSSALVDSFVLRNPPERKARKRCAQYDRRDFQTKLMRFFLTLNCSFCWLNSESEFTFEKLTALTIGA